MNKRLFIRLFVVSVMLSSCLYVNAREWHINSNIDVKAHFVDINAAMASADVIDGDTLYIGSGCNMTSAQTISKQVTVIGTGWDFSGLPHIEGRISNNLTISCAGAKVIGLYVTGWIMPKANDILIERCRFSELKNWNSTTYLHNVKILSCHTGRIHANINYTKYNANWEIRGNIIVYNGNDNGAIYGLDNAVVENNVILYGYQGHSVIYYSINCVFKNNVIMHLKENDINNLFNGCSGTITDNLLSASSGFSGNKLLAGNDPAEVFRCTGSVTAGEYYSLRDASPAIGAGYNGVDCGAMEGLYKFCPYGKPRGIPVIKEALVPSIPTDGKVKVSFKIENCNE